MLTELKRWLSRCTSSVERKVHRLYQYQQIQSERKIAQVVVFVAEFVG